MSFAGKIGHNASADLETSRTEDLMNQARKQCLAAAAVLALGVGASPARALDPLQEASAEASAAVEVGRELDWAVRFRQGFLKLPFDERVQLLESACSFDAMQCRGPIEVEFLDVRLAENRGLMRALKEKAFEQAQIWGDTILEGDYAASADTRLSAAAVYVIRGVVVGYYIRYYEKAAETYRPECDETALRDGDASKCDFGVIAESAFVSHDLKEVSYSERAGAEFKRIPGRPMRRG